MIFKAPQLIQLKVLDILFPGSLLSSFGRPQSQWKIKCCIVGFSGVEKLEKEGLHLLPRPK